MLEEALFFVLGGVLTWGYGRIDARRRAAVHEQTREQIAELKAVVEETLTRIGETGRPAVPSPEGSVPAGSGEPADVPSGMGIEDLGLESALLRLKAHLEDADG